MARRDYLAPIVRLTRPTLDPREPPRVWQSQFNTGAGYAPLSEATIVGTRYVFAFSDLGMSRVEWWLDGQLSYTTTSARAAGGWPYLGVDGNGNIVAWDTTGLGNGQHTLEARVTADGNVSSVVSRFNVNNVVTPPPPTGGNALAGTNYDNAATIDALWASGGYQVNSPGWMANVTAPSGFTTTLRSGAGRVLQCHNVDAPTLGSHERCDVLNGDSSKLGGVVAGPTGGSYRVYSLSFATASTWNTWTIANWSWIHSLHSSYNYPGGGQQSYHPYAFQLMPSGAFNLQTHGGPVAPDGNLYPNLPGGGATYQSPYTRNWSIMTLNRTTWYDMVYDVQMSSEGAGRMRVWINGVLRLDTGSNVYIGIRSPESYYWKQGHTRGPDSSGTADLYHDNTYRWNSVADAFSYYGWS